MGFNLLELSLEAAGCLDDPRSDSIFQILQAEDLALEANDKLPAVELPTYLYHGSAYRQKELMPGFKRSGEVVHWDKTESNEWLYTSDDKTDAAMLGIASAIEKAFRLDHYSYDDKKKSIRIESPDDITVHDIQNLHVVVYTIKATNDDGWMHNHNPNNGISGEYKTQRTIDSNIIKCEDVRVSDQLRGIRVQIVKSEPSMESLSTIVDGVKKFFGMKSAEEKRKDHQAQAISGVHTPKVVEDYLSQFFGNESWLSKQTFNDEVSTAGLVPALSMNGKFLSTLSDVEKAVHETTALAKKADGLLNQMNDRVQAVHSKFSKLITVAMNEEDNDKASKLVDEAEVEFGKIDGKAVLALAGSHSIGGEVLTKVQSHWDGHEWSRRNQWWLGNEKVKVGAPAKVKALDKAGVVHAVKLIRELLKYGEEKIFWQHWLDITGSDDFIDKLHDFDEVLYMMYIDRWEQQSASQVFSDSLPHPYGTAEDTIIALLHWMDRSIKGDVK